MSLILPSGFENRPKTGLILSRKFTDSDFGLGIGIGISAKYKIAVCRNGGVIRKPFGDDWIPNLITNSGLDNLINLSSNTPFHALFNTARAGSGTTAPANTDTQLTTQLAGQNTTTLLGSGNGYSNDTTVGAWTGTWVYEFPAATSGITVNEIALAWTSTQGTGTNAITTHALTPSAVTLNTGDNLRLTYSVTLSIPSLVTPITVSLSAINGFNISGQLKVCGLYSSMFGTVASNASSTTAGAPNQGIGSGIYPGGSGSCQASLMTAPTSFPAVNTSPSETIISGSSSPNATYSTYTNGTFTRTATYVWNPSTPASTVTVNTIRFAFYNLVGPYLILTTPQSKANTNTLTVVLTYNWTRV
jgi:hypothetical protein